MQGRILSKDALLKSWDPEHPLPILFFPDSGGSCEGEPGPACLSQWGPFPFEHEGLRFPTSEHWMMHGKAALFGDQEMAQAILGCRTSWKAKEYGRRVRGFDAALWESHATSIVVEGNLLKFRQHPRFGEWLVATAPAILAEASPTDEVWGIGLSEADRTAGDPRRWPGRNLLGFALMRVREILSRE
ncbi:MAG: hypothetical protein RL318_1701 [Fibrobacterota bacterium]|jgi:ribA/ribD-fused uncharacterized protein